MICENCGNEVPEHKIYCDSCGKEVRHLGSRPVKYSDEARARPSNGHKVVGVLLLCASASSFVLAILISANFGPLMWAYASALNYVFGAVASMIGAILAFRRERMSLVIVCAILGLFGVGVYGTSLILTIMALVTLFLVGEDYDRRRIAEA